MQNDPKNAATNPIPSFLTPFLWSYDISRLDLQKDKKRIITNLLNGGTEEATNWLFQNFKREDMQEVIKNPLPGEWNKKSMNFWSLILEVPAGNTVRQIP